MTNAERQKRWCLRYPERSRQRRAERKARQQKAEYEAAIKEQPWIADLPSLDDIAAVVSHPPPHNF